MNQRQAKRLRREAKELSQANKLPWLQYDADFYQKWYTNLMGERSSYRVFTGYMINCGRKLYQELKKEYYQQKSV